MQFSITARKEPARLSEVIAQMQGEGFDFVVIAIGLSKSDADSLKKIKTAEMRKKGYTYRTRRPLS